MWNAAREKHKTDLRPQLGRPDAAAELKDLRDREAARCAEAKAAIVQVRAETIGEQTRHAQTFVLALERAADATMAALGTLTMCDDLGYLPGDKFIEHKRKSLKRLRKKAHRHKTQEADDAIAAAADSAEAATAVAAANARAITNEDEEHQPPDGRHWTKRDWPPLPVEQMMVQLQLGAAGPPGGGGDGSAAGSASGSVPPSATSPLRPLADGDAEGGGDGARGWDDSVAIAAKKPVGFVTTAHRVLVRSRNDAFNAFLEVGHRVV